MRRFTALRLPDILRAMPFVALLLLAGALSYRYHQLLLSQRNLIEHTYQVMTTLETTFARVIDAETGQRGFVITGVDNYLAPYDRALKEIPELTQQLRGLVADSVDQRARVDELNRRLAVKLAELHETVAVRQSQGLEAARLLVLRDDGRNQMDAVRAVIDAMRRAELDLLSERTAQARHTERLLLFVTLLCTVLSVVARIGLTLMAKRLPNPRR